MATKLEAILERKGWKQVDLIREMYKRSGFVMGRDMVSRIVTGVKKTYRIDTAVMIAEALEVTVDEIIEVGNITKKNIDEFVIPMKIVSKL